MVTVSTRQTFSIELDNLRVKVLNLGALVADMLSNSVTALAQRDEAKIDAVLVSEMLADDLDREVEQECMRLLVLQQPLSADLRAIVGALRMATELERIGDYSKDIAKVALRLRDEEFFKPLNDIPRMASLAGEMLRTALRAFADHAPELAATIPSKDKVLDVVWHGLRTELAAFMRKDPGIVNQALEFLLVARYLERVGDHIVNIAERVYYVETGDALPSVKTAA
jgi:phosphate transport system protein